MDVLTVKIIAMILIGSISLFLGLVPIKIAKLLNRNNNRVNSRRPTWSNLILSALLCFGGGVILATIFTHMLPEVRELTVDDEETSKVLNTHLPLAEIFMCCGFFLIYLIEELMHIGIERFMHGHKHDSKACGKPVWSVSAVEQARTDNLEMNSGGSSLPNGGTVNLAFDSSIDNTCQNTHIQTHTKAGHSHNLPSMETGTFKATLRGLLIVLALSFHAVFEGLAVGLQNDAEDVWKLFFAISAHKYVIAFCVGLQCVTSGIRTIVVVVYLTVFSLVSPLGVAVGAALTETAADGSYYQGVLIAVLQGIATGTLLYVVFFEVLEQERAKGYNGLMQFFSLLIGFGCMLALTSFGGHSHSHGGHGHSHDHDHDHDHDHEDHHHDNDADMKSYSLHGLPASLVRLKAVTGVMDVL